MRVTLLLTAIALLASASDAHAALEWKLTELRLKSTVGQEKLSAVFPFRNAGSVPVRLVSVETSCHCLAAKPRQEVYAPGETGEISAELALAGQAGAQARTLTVTTDDPAAKPTLLTVLLDIPEPVSITPRFLYWTPGGDPAEKRITLSFAAPDKTALEGFESRNPSFEVSLENSNLPGQHVLRVRPKKLALGEMNVITLKVNTAGHSHTYHLHAAVIAKEPLNQK